MPTSAWLQEHLVVVEDVSVSPQEEHGAGARRRGTARARWLPLYIALSPPECEVNTVSLSRFLPAEERCSTISSRDCPIGNLRDRAPGTYLLSVFPAVGPY